MKDPYLTCYLSGRGDEYEGEVDTAMLVAKVLHGSPLRDVCIECARNAITKEMDATVKVAWLKDNIEAIRKMGGDTEKAWRQFCAGRTDALAYQLEEEALEEIVNQLEDEDGDDEEEDEEEEGDEDEDEDEDDDDDDEEEEP